MNRADWIQMLQYILRRRKKKNDGERRRMSLNFNANMFGGKLWAWRVPPCQKFIIYPAASPQWVAFVLSHSRYTTQAISMWIVCKWVSVSVFVSNIKHINEISMNFLLFHTKLQTRWLIRDISMESQHIFDIFDRNIWIGWMDGDYSHKSGLYAIMLPRHTLYCFHSFHVFARTFEIQWKMYCVCVYMCCVLYIRNHPKYKRKKVGSSSGSMTLSHYIFVYF